MFPTGLSAIVLTGAELVTSSFSTVGGAWMSDRFDGKHGKAAFNLIHVYFVNLLGALAVMGLAYGSGTLDPSRVAALADKKAHLSAGAAIARGVVCNWLVSLAVHLSFSAQDAAGKILALWPPIAAFVAVGGEHCVANMFYLPLGIAMGAETNVGEAIVRNLLPVTFGNALGSLLVSVPFSARHVWIENS